MEKNSEETLCSRGGNVHSSTFCAFLVFPSSLALTHSDLNDSKTQFRRYFLTSVLPGLHPSFFFFLHWLHWWAKLFYLGAPLQDVVGFYFNFQMLIHILLNQNKLLPGQFNSSSLYRTDVSLHYTIRSVKKHKVHRKLTVSGCLSLQRRHHCDVHTI